MKHFFILLTSLFLYGYTYSEDNSRDTIRVQDIEEITVYAFRTSSKLKELPAKVEVITQKTISQSGAGDMTDLLKNNTSVDVIQYPNFLAGIGMRGFAPSTSTPYVTMLLDGIPSGSTNISTLMLNGVQQVEILKGPFSSLYGSSAMGGLINIVPRKNKEDITGRVGLAYGSAQRINSDMAIGGKLVGGLSFDFSAFYNKLGEDYKTGRKNFYHLDATEKAIIDKGSYGRKMQNTSYEAKGGNLRLGYDFNEHWNLNLISSYFATDDIITNGSYFKVYTSDKKDILQYATRLSVEGRVNNHLLKFNPYFSNDYVEYATLKTNYKTSENTTKTYGVQFQDAIELGKQKVVLGFDNLNVMDKSKLFNKKDGAEKMPYNPNYRNNTLGVFAQANLKLWEDKLLLVAGARYDAIKLTLEANQFMKNEKKSEVYNKFSPNVGMKVNIDKNSTFHMNYGQAFLAPTAYQKAGQYTGLYGTTKGNPNLKGESSSTFDVGVEYKSIEKGINLDITYFSTRHKDLIVSKQQVSDSGNNEKTFDNADKAEMSGVEVIVAYDFGALVDYAYSLKAYFNGTFMLKSKAEIAEEWQDIRNIRNQTINFGLQFMTQEKWTARVNGRYMGSRIENNWYNPAWYPNVRPTLATLAKETQPTYLAKELLKHPRFLTFDASVYYNISKSITVGLNANNILDENYTEKDGYNMQGRNFLVKVAYTF